MWSRRLTVPLAVMPVILLTASVVGITLHRDRVAIEADVMAHAMRLASVLETELNGHVKHLTILSEAVQAAGDFVALAQRVQPRFPMWRSLRLTSAAGERLSDFPERVGDATNPLIEPESHRRAVETMKPVIGSVAIGVLNKAAFPIRIPIIRHGQAQYVLTAVLEPSFVHDLIATSGVPRDWHTVVVDGSGNIVAREPGHSALIGRPAAPDTRAVVQKGDPSGLYDVLTILGDQMLAGYRILPTESGGWSVHVGIMRSAVPAALLRHLWIWPFICVVALALNMAALWLLMHKIGGTRKSAEERQNLLTKELLHRTKNLIQIVISIVMRSLKGSKPWQEEKQVLLERLHLLSRADDHFLSSATGKVRLDLVISDTLSLFTDRFAIKGTPIEIDTGTAQNFSLLIHELATNAVKYGALMTKDGTISVEINQGEDGSMTFRWVERGGPPAAIPMRKGFGLTLFDGIARGMRGYVQTNFDQAGFSCEMRTSVGAGGAAIRSPTAA